MSFSLRKILIFIIEFCKICHSHGKAKFYFKNKSQHIKRHRQKKLKTQITN